VAGAFFAKRVEGIGERLDEKGRISGTLLERVGNHGNQASREKKQWDKTDIYKVLD